MKYYVYILYSMSRDRYYVGQTENIENRLASHNAGRTPSTKNGIPWKLVFSEILPSRSEAMKREVEIKSKKRRAYIETLIHSQK
ncbi:MAG TPA: GIY-YIG nuclease family protein [Bacteroidia bacterium]|jgi:putative endonuclease|nr:GIY-YIG nuclease family protein [Bacteroidia bacterium]